MVIYRGNFSNQNPIFIDFGSGAINAKPFRKGEKATCFRCVIRFLLPEKGIAYKFQTLKRNGGTYIVDKSMNRVDGKPIYYVVHCIGCKDGIHEGPTESANWCLPARDKVWYNPMYYNEKGKVLYNEAQNEWVFNDEI